jgi:hypothetical protein
MGKACSMHKILDGEPDGKRPIGRPKRRWENILNKQYRRLWTGFIGLRIGTDFRLQ